MKRKAIVTGTGDDFDVAITVQLKTKRLTRGESRRCMDAILSEVMRIAPHIPFVDLPLARMKVKGA